MLDIAKASCINFKSLRGAHEFWFPEEPGLYHFRGENFFNPRLGANGCGKTTLLDLIYWVFYGYSTRGLKAGEVISWGEKSCSGEIDVIIDDDLHTIARSQNPNKITLDGEQVQQAAVDKLLRMNADAFLYAIILPQFGQSFFDLLPGPKLTLFSNIMHLDFWLDKSKAAGAKADRIQEVIRQLDKDLARLDGQRQTLMDNHKELSVKAKEYSAERKVTLRRSAKHMDKLDDKIAELREAAPVMRDNAISARKTADKIALARKQLEDEVYQETRLMAALEGDITDGRRRADVLMADRKHFDSLKGATCPTCLQPVDAAHLKKQEGLIQGLLNQHFDKLDHAEAEFGRAKRRRKKLREQIVEEAKTVELALDKAAGHEQALRDLEQELRDNERELERYESDHQKLKMAANPYEGLLEVRAVEIDKIEKEIESAEESLSKNRTKFDAVSFWVGGFKRIRLLIIEEAIKQLEIEINNNLTALGLGDWRIILDVERENKSGGITKGFSVLIMPPGVNAPIRYEAFSGGETQRLRLAGDFGFADLILQRAGLVGCIEVHDEPSEHMSTEGLADLIEILRERAESQQKKIWLVDHSSFDYGDFAGVLTARRTEAGSELLFEAGTT